VSRLSAEPGVGAELRALAATLAASVLRRHRTFQAALGEAGGAAAEDRPLLGALLYGVFRWHHRLQWQLGRLLRRPLDERDVELAALLRVGLFQLQWLRIPDHAAVSATVDAAALLGRQRARGLVNAVLRRYLRERRALDQAMEAVDEAVFSHPQWMIETIRSDHGGVWREILSANNAAPPMWLRVNRRRTSLEAYRRSLTEAGLATEVSTDVPDALELVEPVPTERLPGFAEGLVSVQDAAAQLAAGYLDPAPGARVLDACAAPGGKTAHLLERYPAIAELWALDRNAGRLDAVAANLARLGLHARLVHADAAATDDWWDGRGFDSILVDAPCSALGVIRRHPDIKVLRKKDDVERLVATQRRLLDRLWPLLAPGGRLLYSTCTLTRAENSDQVSRFVGETPDARLSGPGPDGGVQRLPGRANMDGFYYACIVKGAS
jgi:16S rRNA (cytosine967-C5)-methyltransferase